VDDLEDERGQAGPRFMWKCVTYFGNCRKTACGDKHLEGASNALFPGPGCAQEVEESERLNLNTFRVSWIRCVFKKIWENSENAQNFVKLSIFTAHFNNKWKRFAQKKILLGLENVNNPNNRL
jgi:hypothetical protein